MAAHTQNSQKNLPPMTPLEAALIHHSVSQSLLYVLPSIYQIYNHVIYDFTFVLHYLPATLDYEFHVALSHVLLDHH